MLIRPERAGEEQEIYNLTKRAFAPMPFGDEDDAGLTDALRESGDLFLSLIAEENSRIIGHLALSPVAITGTAARWMGLGPISVEPERQRQGIGSTLVQSAMTYCRTNEISGIALIGNPAVYGPMGFQSNHAFTYRDLSNQLVQYLTLSGSDPVGELTFAPALEGQG